ncbi:FkbM family methyltransferase [Pontibaca salina]|uniref:FkbM family methyltransferase n=1 Tax=Pontibaca salina TaxID=2795731 RepID=A0A934HMV3_9RHOB|nr:FkbM family methyltransferase [Pontibaca salina]MBI6630993.1 FkbM family methyltransferase [Pontibaca salina]
MSIVTLAKKLIQKQLNHFGWEIKRVNSGDISDLVGTLNSRGAVKLLDVGANLGQYASSVFAAGFKGEVVSFEPLGNIHAKLAQNAASNPRWRVHERCAVGAAAGTVTINRAANAVSSSVLTIEEAHVSAAPTSKFTCAEEVTVIALDDLPLADLEWTFLKIDTQGFEGQVLEGAAQLLPEIAGVQLEISIAPLYKDQADYFEIFDVMHAAGLRLWSVEPGFRDPRTRQLLQFDAIFLR